MRAVLIVLALLSVLVSGCMTPAKRLEEGAVLSQLRKGQTQTEVRALLGTPNGSEMGSNGKCRDIYRLVLGKSTPGTPLDSDVIEVRSVYVLYDRERHVENFSYYAGEARGVMLRFSGQWRAGRPVGTDDVEKITRGVTSRDGLLEMFGPATFEGLDVEGRREMGWLYGEGQGGFLLRGYELWSC